MSEMMTAGMDPEKISGPSFVHGHQSQDLDLEIISGHSLQSQDLNMMTAGVGSGHGLQSQDLNIASQVESSDRSKKRKRREEHPEEGRAVVAPRPRGRPKGSRNKPKDRNDKLKCHAFLIPDRNDVWNTMETFTRRSQLGVSILSGTGMVSDVTLRHPLAPMGEKTYKGPLQILSLSGYFPYASENQEATGITVSLADLQGVIVAGSVVGNLVAYGRVFVIAGTVDYIRCEPLNVHPMPVKPWGLLHSPGRTEVEQQMIVPVIGSNRNAATDKHEV